MRSLRLLVTLVVLSSAGAAGAQTSLGTFQMILKKKTTTGFDNMNAMEQLEFFNAVNCNCNRRFAVEVTVFNPNISLDTQEVEFWLGSNCAVEDLTDRNTRCIQATTRELRELHDQSETIEFNVADLMFPKRTQGSQCPEQSGQNTVWAIVDIGRDGTIDQFASLNPVITYDAKPPTPPERPQASGVENAVAITWQNPAGTSDINRFQVFCASSKDGSPVFIEPPDRREFDPTEDEFQPCMPTSSPGGDAGVPDAGAGADDAGVDVPDAAAGPDANGGSFAGLDNLDPEFVCTGRLGGGTSSVRIDLSDPNKVRPLDPDEGIVSRLVAMDTALNIRVVDVPNSGPPGQVTDAWEHYHEAGGTADGGFCFVATAVYGDYDHPYVRVLREFRDGTLASFGAGRAFINWYYTHSPAAADYLRRHDVARALAAAALFPVVAVVWAWNVLGAAGLVAMAVLFWAWRRRRRSAVLAAAAVLALFAAARSASAQAVLDTDILDEPAGPPLSRWAFEIKVGLYHPDVDGESGLMGSPFDDVFGSGSSIFAGVELDHFFFHYYGQLGLAAAIGYTGDSAKAFKQDPNTGATLPDRSEDSTAFRMLPLSLSVVYRMTELADRTVIPLVPYAKLGLSYYLWQITKGDGSVAETDENGKARGGTLGWQATVGISLRADRLDPDAARSLTADLGVEHAGFFFELTYADVSGLFQDNRLHVGDFFWAAGVNFEF